ncbi:ABC transporter ATP-binding protein [Salsipaludibacter albus]|uniref:ABC transporter ATP-binding protein n=1 Tax=Salsipaludibacter albus TaxID=2849650 RepID=UPI001EE498CE|nr:ABC transporter ATP-binding protein [Salsipaludibacter albus]MBY5160961.1 ABC transporter ATP-binding protein [Salsipaludibacter albus]
MAGIHIEGLRKQFPDGTVAVEHLDLEIADGELFVLLGPSGCGKTTTLRCIAGLEHQTSGDIRIGDQLVNGRRAGERDIAMVFQFYALYPHLSARDNIAFPLRAQSVAASEVERRVAASAEMLKITDLLDRKPSRLSGGEQQRIALARALVRAPQAFLMDEPLTNLDAELRIDMRTEIKHLQAELGTTMVYVTHDQVEAMSLGDRIGIVNNGRLEQVGAPLDVYRNPATLFAAGFIGTPPMNLFDVRVDGQALVGPAGLRLPRPAAATGTGLVAGVRAEWLGLVGPDDDGAPGQVVATESLGDETIYVVDVEGELLSVREPPTAPWRDGDAVTVHHHARFEPRVYDSESGRALGTEPPEDPAEASTPDATDRSVSTDPAHSGADAGTP